MEFSCTSCGHTYNKKSKTQKAKDQAQNPAVPRDQWPGWCKMVERMFRQPADIGIGDSFEHMAKKFGAKAATDQLKKMGVSCGCGNRKKAWNRIYPYKNTIDGNNAGR